MQELNNLLSLIDAHFGGSQWFVFLLLGTGLFFTVYLRFPQLRFFGHAIKVVRGKYDNKQDIGDTSHFQALATALSGTVGTGNIAGVALAIHLGGPSALFWMLMTAFLGMTTKMVEVTLSHKYREQTEDGTISGGPMYYMKHRLHMRWLAGLFGVRYSAIYYRGGFIGLAGIDRDRGNQAYSAGYREVGTFYGGRLSARCLQHIGL